MSEEQVLSSLQTIFAVKLPSASEKAPSENMELPETAALLKLKSEQPESDKDQNDQGAIITKSGLETYVWGFTSYRVINSLQLKPKLVYV